MYKAFGKCKVKLLLSSDSEGQNMFICSVAQAGIPESILICMEGSFIRKLASSKKGSSIMLASLLMVIVTLFGGIFFYNYVMGYVQSMKSNVLTQMSIVLLDTVSINRTHISAWIRNTGNSIVSIVNAYVNNQIALLVREVKVLASSTTAAYISGTYAPGSTYTVKLAGILGALITFDVKYQ